MVRSAADLDIPLVAVPIILMSVIEAFFAWVETTAVTRAISESAWLIPSLSAVHLLGFTLVAGSALLANLKLMGVFLPQRAVIDVTEAANRGIALGLVVSIATGALLFSWRAIAVLANGIFQLKMLLLAAAVVFHFTWQRSMTRRDAVGVRLLRVTGVVGLSLWLGLALAGCAFILFE